MSSRLIHVVVLSDFHSFLRPSATIENSKMTLLGGDGVRKRKSNSIEVLNDRIPRGKYREGGEKMLSKTTLIRMSHMTLSFPLTTIFSTFSK